jgi:hypothetical protein
LASRPQRKCVEFLKKLDYLCLSAGSLLYRSEEKEIFVEEGEETASSLARWLPRVVVVVAVGGFAGLAWYAYHSGAQSIKEEDLLVVEAEKGPMKEKPTDPGGMKFPNQDKTIYDTFANSGQGGDKVERVLPAPEEPIQKPAEAEASGTQTWVNDKLPKQEDGRPEQVIGEHKGSHVDDSKMSKSAEKMAQSGEETISSYTIDRALTGKDAAPTEAKSEPKNVATPSTDTVKPVVKTVAQEMKAAVKTAPQDETKPKIVRVTPVEETKPVAAVAPEKPSTPEKEVEKALAKPVAAASSAAPAAGGKAKIQLGAYRSESEAKSAFSKMKDKFPDLADRSPIIVKADLGAKGIYYRLRVGGLSVADAKSLCSSLTSKGQACITALD